MKSSVLIIDSFQVQWVLEKAVHLGLEQGPGMKNRVVLIGVSDSIGPYSGIVMQMGDNAVNFVGIIIMREGNGLIVEIELAHIEEHGICHRFPGELRWRFDFEVFEYRSRNETI